MHWFRHYLVVVTEDDERRSYSTSGPRSSSATLSSSPPPERKQTLTVFDVQNKFVAFTAPLGRPAKWLLSEWGLLYAVSDDGDCR